MNEHKDDEDEEREKKIRPLIDGIKIGRNSRQGRQSNSSQMNERKTSKHTVLLSASGVAHAMDADIVAQWHILGTFT
jgi:hypothetical protein